MRAEAPPTPPEAGDRVLAAPRPRRRIWRWIAVAVIGALLAAAFSTWLWAVRDRPLVTVSTNVPRFGYRIGPRDYLSEGVWGVGYHTGATTSFAVQLANVSGHGITLTGVDLPRMTLLRQVGVHAGSLDVCCAAAYGQLPPLETISVPAEHSIYIQIATGFTGCRLVGAGALEPVDHVVVHLRVFGIPRTELVPLDRTFVVVSPADAGCSGRPGGGA